jgi:hypothetical protein
VKKSYHSSFITLYIILETKFKLCQIQKVETVKLKNGKTVCNYELKVWQLESNTDSATGEYVRNKAKKY